MLSGNEEQARAHTLPLACKSSFFVFSAVCTASDEMGCFFGLHVCL